MNRCRFVAIVLAMLVSFAPGSGVVLNGTGSSAGRLHASEAAAPATSRPEVLKVYRSDRGEERTVVYDALRWLAEHQLADGGWSFNHHKAPKCQGKCGEPGSLGDEGRNAATALALLALLAGGRTHQHGEFQETVNAGLKFLVFRAQRGPHGASLWEKGGTMYSHGLATIALCETYGMTGDANLKPVAQQAIDFIVYCQDPVGGGWRYQPRQKGDTSVTGLQVMALRSGQLAGLKVPKEVLDKANRFLDSTQADDGAAYGYIGPGEGQTTTAVGLLARLCLGWKADDPRLKRGVERIAKRGPSKNNLYCNIYATYLIQSCDDRTGSTFRIRWNSPLRNQLTDTQSTQGHETGSWIFAKGDHGIDRGGRLYCTAMAVLSLEVYYRHLLLFRKPLPEEKPPTKSDSK